MIEVELIQRGIQNSPAQIIRNHSDAQEKLKEYSQFIPDSEYDFIMESLYEMEVLATLERAPQFDQSYGEKEVD